MTQELTLKDAKKYQDLLAKQFLEMARTNFVTTEKLWNNFLDHPKTKGIDMRHLPIVKGILFGKPTLSIKDYRDALLEVVQEIKYCQVMDILYLMSDGNLLPELVEQSNIVIGSALRT